MKYTEVSQINFFSELSELQLTARAFFTEDLLVLIEKAFGLKNILISNFDTEGNFLSWRTVAGTSHNAPDHPYGAFLANDSVRRVIYQDALRDRLTYFNVTPRLYKSTDIIDPIEYKQSAYVRFIEKNFGAHYSATLVFGINAYIQMTFFKREDEGDFSEAEIDDLTKIYVYIASAYKTFKKHEQSKIVSDIQNNIIASGEKAYLVTDDFMHVLSYNQEALVYLEDILGVPVDEEITRAENCNWLPFLLAGAEKATPNEVRTRTIRDHLFRVYTHDQTYSNGIVDRYHWITISRNQPLEQSPSSKIPANSTLLTRAEQRVASLLYQGLSYQAIAAELVVSYHTVKKHVQNIYAKCNVNSKLELCRWMENQEK